MSNVRLVNAVFTTPLWREPEHLFWRCYAWDCFADECELLKYFKYYQVIATRACYPNMLRRGLFLLEGDWGEGKKRKRDGDDGKRKEKEERLSLFPSFHRATLAHFFQIFMIYWNAQ